MHNASVDYNKKMKKTEPSYSYLKKDLALFVTLQGIILLAIVGMHLYNESTGYFSTLAAQIYSHLVK